MAKEEQDKREGLFTGQDADGNDVTVYVKKSRNTGTHKLVITKHLDRL